MLIGFLILAGSVGYNILVSRVVRNRTRALVQIIDEKSALEESEKETAPACRSSSAPGS